MTTNETPSPAQGAFTGMFAGKVALLTAATNGIGLATAKLLAAGGARAVYINGRDAVKGERVALEVAAAAPGARVLFLAGDLCDQAAAAGVCNHVLEQEKRLDIFVHAGGGEISPKLFVNLKVDDYRPLIDGHYTSLLYCCNVVAPAMIRQRGGAIVVIASDAGKIATPGESLIGSLKAAAIMFARTLSVELSRHNVRVNCVTPSLVAKTRAYDRVMSSEFGKKIFSEAASRAWLGVPDPENVAPAAAFLASDMASHITGQAISVNGGISAA